MQFFEDVEFIWKIPVDTVFAFVSYLGYSVKPEVVARGTMYQQASRGMVLVDVLTRFVGL